MEWELQDAFEPKEWLDGIIAVDEFGNIEYERDEDGNVVQAKDHFGRPLFNPYTGEPVPQPKWLQEGTRISEERMNRIEQALWSLFVHKDRQDKDIEYILIILELEGLVTGGQGSFFDSFDEVPPKDIEMDTTKTVTTQPVEAGDAIVFVESTEGFELGQNVMLYDGVNFEELTITQIVSTTEIKVGQTLAYKKGAYLTRSSVFRATKKLVLDKWLTYKVESEVI